MTTDEAPVKASMMVAELQAYVEAAILCESRQKLGPAQMQHALSIELVLKTAAQRLSVAPTPGPTISLSCSIGFRTRHARLSLSQTAR